MLWQRFLTLSVYNFFTRLILRNFVANNIGDMKRLMNLLFAAVAVVSCEILDDDPGKHAPGADSTYIELSDVAQILAALPIESAHLQEVHEAASGSLGNGYDEEYTMKNLFAAPGCGVGEEESSYTKALGGGKASLEIPLMRDLIKEYLLSVRSLHKAAPATEPETFLDALSDSDIQIYWPFSENWDGESLPIITFDPEDGSDVNVGYRLQVSDDGVRMVEEVIVDETMAAEEPVWVVNRNSDAEYTTLEMLRRQDPSWGQGGGTIIVKPSGKTKSTEDTPMQTLVLKDFTMRRNQDAWFCGGSEFWIKTGSLDDFTASTEAELRLYNPLVTDFLIVVKRSQLGVPQPFNAVLIPEWNKQMTHCAFMITEDDGGTLTEWKCTALVRVASKSYGVELNLPFNSRDDIIWRGHLTNRWIEANSLKTSNFGDVSLTFELVEY